jgi:hypothetical protein
MLIVALLSAAYLVASLPGYLYYSKCNLKNPHSSDIATLLIPMLLYFALAIVEDRQGFNMVFASLAIGGIVSLAFVVRAHWQVADQNRLFMSVLIGAVVAVWIFLPQAKMRLT